MNQNKTSCVQSSAFLIASQAKKIVVKINSHVLKIGINPVLHRELQETHDDQPTSLCPWYISAPAVVLSISRMTDLDNLM